MGGKIKGEKIKCSFVPMPTVLTEFGSWVLGAGGARVGCTQRGMISPDSGHHLLLSYFLPSCCQQAAQDLCSHLQQTPGPAPGHQTNSEPWFISTWTLIYINSSTHQLPTSYTFGKLLVGPQLVHVDLSCKTCLQTQFCSFKGEYKALEWDCSIL